MPFPARQNDPARTAAFKFRKRHIKGNFKRRRKRLAGLTGEHADLEAGIVLKPCLLIGVENRRFHHAPP